MKKEWTRRGRRIDCGGRPYLISPALESQDTSSLLTPKRKRGSTRVPFALAAVKGCAPLTRLPVVALDSGFAAGMILL